MFQSGDNAYGGLRRISFYPRSILLRPLVPSAIQGDWQLLGVIATKAKAWLVDDQQQLDTARSGEVLRLLYESLASQENPDFGMIERMLKVVASRQGPGLDASIDAVPTQES